MAPLPSCLPWRRSVSCTLSVLCITTFVCTFASGARTMSPASTKTQGRRGSSVPHVLFFLIDDLGYADVGYHGNPVGSAVVTPTIDKLATSGVRLENYYVNFLCSPTRTSLMSGRYAYTIGMNAEVIVDGVNSCMPGSVSTIADRLSKAGWATSAYGKWDMGMTTWGCTPTCRGFGHFFGFYNAFNDYFTHYVGTGLDLRNDTTPVWNLNGTYLTEAVTADAINWLEHTVPTATVGTFAYLAHESNHAPLEVPQSYIDGDCANAIPANRPSRRIVCGMMRAVDSSLTNVTAAYQRLGVWESTIVIMSTDNGGNTDTGGNNYPLRGNKATSWEGGVRGVGWVGGGHPAVNRGIVSNAMIHVSDWYPTIVQGIAKLEVNIPADGTPALDGVNAWPSITTNAPSGRSEMLLQLNPSGTADKLPMAALRVGDFKLITGNSAVFGAGPPGTYYSGDHCAGRDGHFSPKPGATFPYPITNATSPAFCPNGWVPPPEGGNLPEAPPDVHCPSPPGSPCYFPNTSYTNGSGVFLFNVTNDPTEKNNLAHDPQWASTLAMLMTRLDFFVNKSIPQQHPGKDASSDPAKHGGAWTPWAGDPNPLHCAPVPVPPPPPCGIGACDVLQVFANGSCLSTGWCSANGYTGPTRTAEVLIDGNVVTTGPANVARKIAGPHGFILNFKCPSLQSGSHKVEVACQCANATQPPEILEHNGQSVFCVNDGKVVPCPGLTTPLWHIDL
eukprot:m.51896 g.51896  ORF g.51896 m.51896 type:complete len:729 (+) comp7340_c0_seq1:112-2298(+)